MDKGVSWPLGHSGKQAQRSAYARVLPTEKNLRGRQKYLVCHAELTIYKQAFHDNIFAHLVEMLKCVQPCVWRYCLVMLAMLGTALASCDRPENPIALVPRETKSQNWHAIDSVMQSMQTGDIALRTGADATSTMLRMMNRENKTFSHCGIVVVENGYPFVYHAIGGEDNPDERLRRDSAQLFFNPKWNERFGYARMSLEPAQLIHLVENVHHLYRSAPLFDMDFDLTTDERLYCAEFVYKAVQQAVGDSAYLPTTRLSKMHYVGVDNLFENPHARLVCNYRFE